MIKVTIWNEFIHENTQEAAKKMYPGGLHLAIGKGIACDDFAIKYATLEQDENHGLSEEVLADTDVLLWWGHCAHDKVKDEVVDRVMNNVWNGMGLICLHSAHMSKVFRRLNGTSGKLIWREANERERIWCANPGHPIAQGLPPRMRNPFSSRGLKVETSSVAASRCSAATAVSSTSAPDMKPSRRTTTKTC